MVSIIALYLVVMTWLYFTNYEDIIMSAYDSKLYGHKYNNYFIMYFVCILCPWKMYSLIKNKNFTLEKLIMKFKPRYIIIPVMVLSLIYLCNTSAVYYNQ